MMLYNSGMVSKTLVLMVVLTTFFFQISSAQNVFQHETSNENISHLLTSIKKDQQANRIWWHSWLSIYAAATVVQTGIAIKTDNKALRQDMYLGAATTLLGTGSQLLTPYVKFDLGLLETYDLQSPEAQEQVMLLAREYLKASAEYEKQIRSWQNHVLTTVVNMGSGLITWLAFDRTLKDGLINFAINEAVTEVQIWTQPVFAKKQFDRLTTLNSTSSHNQKKLTNSTFYASATPAGFQLKIVF